MKKIAVLLGLIFAGTGYVFADDVLSEVFKAVEKNDKGGLIKIINNAGRDSYVYDQKNSRGETPLHVAAKNGYTPVAKVLIENSADLSAKNNQGLTPLGVAALNNQLVMVNFLIMNGANPNNYNVIERDVNRLSRNDVSSRYTYVTSDIYVLNNIDSNAAKLLAKKADNCMAALAFMQGSDRMEADNYSKYWNSHNCRINEYISYNYNLSNRQDFGLTKSKLLSKYSGKKYYSEGNVLHILNTKSNIGCHNIYELLNDVAVKVSQKCYEGRMGKTFAKEDFEKIEWYK